MTRSAACWEAGGLSERFPEVEYGVFYSLVHGYCVRHRADVPAGMTLVCVFLGGDIYADAK